MSETKKQAVRIFGNYTRLLLTLALGITVVPLTIRWLGDHAFGIISLLGAGLGLAATFSVIIQMSLVRELGHAYHADDETFKRHYATVCQIAIVCALLLATWVLYERRRYGIRHGWIAIPLSVAPGVATAFAFYLVLRSRYWSSASAPAP